MKTISGRVRFNRAIINPKWDSYYNYSNLHRLHILFGECNMSEYATLLKIGTTSLVLDLIEDGLLPQDLEITDPLEALKTVSRDPKWKWNVRRKRGGMYVGHVDRAGAQFYPLRRLDERRDEHDARGDILRFVGDVLADETFDEAEFVRQDESFAVFAQGLAPILVDRVDWHGEKAELHGGAVTGKDPLES